MTCFEEAVPIYGLWQNLLSHLAIVVEIRSVKKRYLPKSRRENTFFHSIISFEIRITYIGTLKDEKKERQRERDIDQTHNQVRNKSNKKDCTAKA